MGLKAPAGLSAETHGAGASKWVSRPLPDSAEAHSVRASEQV